MKPTDSFALLRDLSHNDSNQAAMQLSHIRQQHQQHLVEWQQRETSAQQSWQGKQQKTNAFTKLQQRSEHLQKKQAERLEQKQMDEMAQRAVLRTL